jgi:hypothetical protein
VNRTGQSIDAFARREVHYEYHHREKEWVPQIFTLSDEDTWERKGDQWKLVRRVTYRADNRVDPEYQKAVDQLLIDAARAPCSTRDYNYGLCR